MEVQEVFRIDIIPQVFEGAEPQLRVIFNITQQPAREMELDYPFELPEEPFRRPHKALAVAYQVYEAVYAGDTLQALAIEQAYHHAEPSMVRQVFSQYKNNLDIGQWRHLAPSEFCTFFHLNGMNGGLEHCCDEEEIELMQSQLNYIFTTYPEYSISVLPIMTDLEKLMLFMAEICRRESLPRPN